MKIAHTACWTETLPLTRPYTIAYEHIDSVRNIFVRLQTEDGSVGLGVASPAGEVTGEGVTECSRALAENLETLLTGADIRHLNGLLREMTDAMPGTPAARAAVDMALHDLWAKQLGLPLVDVLGRAHRSLPTSITIGIESIEASLAEAEEYRKRGFRILKIKIGKSLEEDVERLHRIRSKLGSDVVIRVDANQGYSVDQFLAFLRLTAGLELEFVEQPLSAAALEEMRRLPAAVRNRTAADESLLDVRDAIACLSPPGLSAFTTSN